MMRLVRLFVKQGSSCKRAEILGPNPKMQAWTRQETEIRFKGL